MREGLPEVEKLLSKTANTSSEIHGAQVLAGQF
jgi:hypothetical protein